VAAAAIAQAMPLAISAADIPRISASKPTPNALIATPPISVEIGQKHLSRGAEL